MLCHLIIPLLALLCFCNDWGGREGTIVTCSSGANYVLSQRNTQGYATARQHPTHKPRALSAANETTQQQLLGVASEGDVRAIRELLNLGVDANAADELGNTALHHASRHDRAAAIEVLLDGGGDVHARDEAGNTALHVASIHGHAAAIAALLDGGAAVDARNEDGETPRDLAVKLGMHASAELLGAMPPCDGVQGKAPVRKEATFDCSKRQSSDNFRGCAGTEYLQYFIQGGLGNQMQCLKNAYDMALATGRGLILSPIAPHFKFCSM